MELSNKMVVRAFLFAFFIVFTIIAILVVYLTRPSGYEGDFTTFIIQNQTTETLQIYGDNLFQGKAIPGDVVKFETLTSYSETSIIAKNLNGEKVFEINLTPDDLHGKSQYRVVIPPDVKPSEPSDNATQNREAPQDRTALLFKIK
ncbi:hypothetical protein ACFLUP_02395 [Chloroflexota bacterium]